MSENKKTSNNTNNKKKKNNKRSWITDVIIMVLFLAGIALVMNSFNEMNKEIKTVSYQEFNEVIKKEFKKEKPREVSLTEYSDGAVLATFTEKIKDKETEITTVKTEILSTSTSPKTNNLHELITKYDINHKYEVKGNTFAKIMQFLFYGIIIFFFWMMLAPMLKGNRFGSQAGSKIKEEQNKVSFDDIGGLTDEVRKEITQTQELIKKPELAKTLGIKPSKGIILEGPSGTGKTIIARAIASSFEAEFISVSGSEFVELFAGMGAKKVRDLFETAQKNAPSVIFIDEIDAVAKKRSNNSFSSNDEREQTLNQLLVCMDGAVETSDILIIAATNRVDMLDAALLRPGRFDYKIKIDLPDLKGREEIMNIHLKNRPISEDMKSQVKDFSKSLVGFSGAEIEQIVNIAAYKAFNDNRDVISKEDFDNALDRIILGNETRALTTEEMKLRVAYHEAGHTVASAILNPGHIRKVTILPRGGAGGYLAEIPKEGLKTDVDLRNQVKIFLAGGVAEKFKFGNHSYGVDNDFEQSKNLIKNMVERWGMGETKLKPTFSEEELFEQCSKIYDECLNETIDLIKDNADFFEEITQSLLEKETLDGEYIENEIYSKYKK